MFEQACQAAKGNVQVGGSDDLKGTPVSADKSVHIKSGHRTAHNSGNGNSRRGSSIAMSSQQRTDAQTDTGAASPSSHTSGNRPGKTSTDAQTDVGNDSPVPKSQRQSTSAAAVAKQDLERKDAVSVVAVESTSSDGSNSSKEEHVVSSSSRRSSETKHDVAVGVAAHDSMGSGHSNAYLKGTNVDSRHQQQQQHLQGQLPGQGQGKLRDSGKWSRGLHLPQKLSIGTLAKHAGVDRAFMQV